MTTTPPSRRPRREPFRLPIGVALLAVLFVVGLVLVVIPEFASGGWGGFWSVVQIGGLILAGGFLHFAG
jgi:hypothetical protein